MNGAPGIGAARLPNSAVSGLRMLTSSPRPGAASDATTAARFPAFTAPLRVPCVAMPPDGAKP